MLDAVARFRELMGAPNNATTEMVLLALAQEIREECARVCELEANKYSAAKAIRALSQNAANHSEAGIAESQAPATSEPGDRGVAPTSSAPSAAPTSETPLTNMWLARHGAIATDPEYQFATLARRLEIAANQMREALRKLRSIGCLNSQSEAASAAYDALTKENIR